MTPRYIENTDPTRHSLLEGTSLKHYLSRAKSHAVQAWIPALGHPTFADPEHTWVWLDDHLDMVFTVYGEDGEWRIGGSNNVTQHNAVAFANWLAGQAS